MRPSPDGIEISTLVFSVEVWKYFGLLSIPPDLPKQPHVHHTHQLLAEYVDAVGCILGQSSSFFVLTRNLWVGPTDVRSQTAVIVGEGTLPLSFIVLVVEED